MGFTCHFQKEEVKTLAASSTCLKRDNNPLLAETMTLEKAIDLARDCCFQRVQFEYDNKELVEIIQSKYFGK